MASTSNLMQIWKTLQRPEELKRRSWLSLLWFTGGISWLSVVQCAFRVFSSISARIITPAEGVGDLKQKGLGGSKSLHRFLRGQPKCVGVSCSKLCPYDFSYGSYQVQSIFLSLGHSNCKIDRNKMTVKKQCSGEAHTCLFASIG